MFVKRQGVTGNDEKKTRQQSEVKSDRTALRLGVMLTRPSSLGGAACGY